MDNEQTFYLTMWCALMCYLPLMILYYQSRFIHPIKGRFPRAALFGCCCSVLTTTMDCFSIVLNGPCSLRNGFGVPMLMLWIDSLNYRLAQLLFLYHIAKNVSELKNKKFEDWKFNWFTRNRFLVQNQWAFSIGVTLFAINIFISIFYITTSTICEGQFLYVDASGIVIRLIAMCIMAGKMWGFNNDAFGMRSEFKLFLLIILLITIAGLIQGILPPIKYFSAHMMICVYHIFFFGSLLMPYYQSRKIDNKRDHTSLKDWLQIPNGIQLFSDYLRSEFSEENLLFYLEIEAYKTLPSSQNATMERLYSAATEIWNKYVDPKAPYCVNLPHSLVESIQEKIQSLRHYDHTNRQDNNEDHYSEFLDIFDLAQTEIYRLMAADSFYRFRATQNYIPPSKREHINNSLPNSMHEVEILIQNRPFSRHEPEERHSRSEVSPRTQTDLSPSSPPRAVDSLTNSSHHNFDHFPVGVLKLQPQQSQSQNGHQEDITPATEDQEPRASDAGASGASGGGGDPEADL